MPSLEFSLYIVRCADGSLYTGIATDVARRVAEHEAGRRGAKFMRGKGPFALVFQEVVGDRARASRCEHRVKQLSRLRKLDLVERRLSLTALLDDQVLDEGSA